MELEYKDLYVRTIAREVAQHTVFIGLIYTVVFSSAVSVIIAMILRPTTTALVTYTILLGAIPILATSTIYSRVNSKRYVKKAEEFVRFIEDLNKYFNTSRVELLEAPPPPLISVFSLNNKFLTIVFYDKTVVYANLLEPINVRESEGYVPIYLVKRREWLSTRRINNRNVATYKAEAAVPDPLKDRIIEGLFYIHESRFNNPTAEDVYEFIETILKSS